MKNLLPKKSKRGVTLVECVIAVVLLGLLAVGVLNLLTAGGTKIARLSKEAADQAAATQKLDLAISAISNGSDVSKQPNDYIKKPIKTISGEEVTYCYLDIAVLKSALGLGDNVAITAKFSLYDGSIVETTDNNGNLIMETLADGTQIPLSQPLLEIRGWYLTLTYKGQSKNSITVTGFASNSEGVFDKE